MTMTDVTLIGNNVGLRSASGVGISGLTISGGVIADNTIFGILTNNGSSSGATIENITIEDTLFSNNGGDWTGPVDNIPNNGDLALFSYSGTALTLSDLTFATETRSSLFVGGAGQDIDGFAFENIDVTSDTAFRVVKLEGLTAGETKDFADLLAGINATGTYEVFAEISGGTSADVIVSTDDVDLIKAAQNDDDITGAGGNDYLQGGSGTDTANYSASLDASMVTMVTDAYPYTAGNQAGWQVAAGAGDGTDLLTGIEILDGAEAGRILLVGNGGFATIQEAVNAANAGDTVLVADGSYSENVTVSEGIKLQSLNGSSQVSVSSITINPLANGSSLTISGFSFANDAAATAILYNSDYADTEAVTINIDGQPMGAVSFDNVTVSGTYAKTLMFIQDYNDFSDLDLSGPTLGSDSGTLAGWTALYIDPMSGVNPANFTPITGSVTSLSLEGLAQAGGNYGWGVPNLINGTLVADDYTGSSGSDVFFTGIENDSIVGGIGTDAALYAGMSAEFTVSGDGSSWTVADGHSLYNEGTDTLASVEMLVFQGYNLNPADDTYAFLGSAADDTITGTAGALIEAGGSVTDLATLLAAADLALDGTVKYYVGQVTDGDVYIVTDANGSGYTEVIQLVGPTLESFDGTVSIV